MFFAAHYGIRKAVWYNDIYSSETTYIWPKCFNFNNILKFSIYQIVLKFSICRYHQLHLILVGPWPGSLDFINEERIWPFILIHKNEATRPRKYLWHNYRKGVFCWNPLKLLQAVFSIFQNLIYKCKSL